MNDTLKLAARFGQLMDVLAQETSRFSKEQLAVLRRDRFEDRIRLIALDRLRHPELFEGIFKTYLKYPTQEEIERRRVGILESYAGKISQEEWQQMKEKVEKLNREHAPSLVRLSPPEVEEKHLADRYQSCFEYYWMSPPLPGSYGGSEHAMAEALDRLRSKN